MLHRWLSAIIAAVACCACEASSPAEQGWGHYWVTVAPQTIQLGVGASDTVRAWTVGGQVNEERSVSWRVHDTLMAQVVDSLANPVTVTARRPGTTVVIARWRQHPTAEAAALLTVQ